MSARVLILGASYGMLPGVKLALAGHQVTFVGKAEEVTQLSAGDLLVRIPLRKSDAAAGLRCSTARFIVPEEADPAAYDFVMLAMQEPHFTDPQVAALTARVGQSGKPCLSLMNLPPPPFLARLGLDGAALEGVYSSSAAWDGWTPGKMSNASPDPQAMRMNPATPGELTVTLASNFKAAPFADAGDQALLETLARDMSRLKVDGVAPPVRLLAHSSVHVPLAKWPMLIAGNCRCVLDDDIRTIRDAVLSDSAASKAVYADVVGVLRALGMDESVIVPFSAYAKAAQQLVRPSSAARAIANGAPTVERVDLLVRNAMQAHGLDTSRIAPVVATIEERLRRNREG